MEWSFDLDDNMTSNLSKIEKALGGNVKGMQAAEKELAKLNKARALNAIQQEHDPIYKQIMGLKLYQSELKASESELDRFKTKQAAVLPSTIDLGTKMGAVSGIMSAVTTKVIELTGKMADLAVGFIKAGVTQTEFREGSIRSLDTTLGSTEEAEKSYKVLNNIAKGTNQNVSDLLPKFKALVEQGASARNAEDILAAASDLDKTNGQGSGDKFSGIYEKIIKSTQDVNGPNRGRGSFDQSSFEDLRTLGKGVQEEFLTTLAAQRKTSERTIRQLIQDGRINASEGGNALMDIVVNHQNKGKGVGFGSKEIGENTPSTQLARIQKNMQDLFSQGKNSPLANALKGIADMLDPESPSGKKLQSAIAGVSDMFTKMIGKLADDPESISKFITSVADGLKDFQSILADTKSFIDAAKEFANIISFAFDVGNVRPFGMIISFISDTVSNLKAKLDQLGNSFAKLTGNKGTENAGDKLASGVTDQVEKGMVSGLLGMLPGVGAASGLLGDAVIDGLKDKLGIHSPSRVMMQLGGYTAQGFSMGIERAPRAELNPLMPAINVPQGRSGMGAGANVSVTVSVDASGSTDPHAVATMTANSIRIEMARFFEGMAVESGAMGAV